MSTPGHQLKACHNCRRQRIKCDRTVPQCLKCVQRGQDCLGYQRLFRWERGLASRGKMRGMTFESLLENGKRLNAQGAQLPWVLTDPLLQDLTQTSRQHLAYFASNVCRDLVLYDVPCSNPFRELIPLTRQYPALLQIIIANSALHMFNASQTLLTTSLPSPSHSSSVDSLHAGVSQSECYNLALTAKHRGLVLLKSALSTMVFQDLDAILAIVLLFVQFELMDAEQSDWRHHVRGARSLIKMVYRSGGISDPAMSALRRCLISNCLVYDIFGSTFTSCKDVSRSDMITNGALSLLQDAEGNHCSSFPIPLLHLIEKGAQLSECPTSSHDSTVCSTKQEHAHFLLESARSFHPRAWATHVQAQSPISDLELRTRIASAHQAATCIYLSRVLLGIESSPQVSENIEALEAKVQSQLSMISPSDPLFAATAWPSFIAGAEAKDRMRQRWAKHQFQMLWEIQPWGLIKGALAVLEMIWARRSRDGNNENADLLTKDKKGGDWLTYVKEEGVDWLIL